MTQRCHRPAFLILFTLVVAGLTLPSSASAAPALSVSPTLLNLTTSVGANPSPQTVRIANSGNGSLKWSILAPAASWLTVSPTSGVNSGTLTVTFRTSALAAGNYQTSFAIAAGNGGSATVSVRVSMLAPTTTQPPTSTTTEPPTSTTTSPDFGAIVRGIRPRGYGATLYTASVAASGGTYHVVSPTGSDSNPGTYSQPFRTINKAAQVAIAGDVVIIKNGTYQGTVKVKNSGTASNPIVFEAENRGGVVLTGGQYFFQPAAWYGGKLTSGGQFYVTLKGLIFRDYSNPLSTEYAPAAVRAGMGWRIEDCLFDRAGQNGLVVVDDNVTVTKSTFQYNYVHAMVVFGRGYGATSPSDTRFVGVSGFRLTDVVIRGNYTSPETLDGRTSSSVLKIGGSKGTVIDNVESYQNNGAGLWFDADNFNYIVRNSYLHDNYSKPGVSPGRGLHLELSWGPALVEKNVFANNAASGVAVSNSWGVEVRYNLFVGNRECVRFADWVGRSGSVGQYALRDLSIRYNQFKDWTNSGIAPYGDRSGGLNSSRGVQYSNVVSDYNTYEPVRNTTLSGWWSDVGFLTTIAQLRAIKTELNGRIGAVKWPY